MDPVQGCTSAAATSSASSSSSSELRGRKVERGAVFNEAVIQLFPVDFTEDLFDIVNDYRFDFKALKNEPRLLTARIQANIVKMSSEERKQLFMENGFHPTLSSLFFALSVLVQQGKINEALYQIVLEQIRDFWRRSSVPGLHPKALHCYVLGKMNFREKRPDDMAGVLVSIDLSFDEAARCFVRGGVDSVTYRLTDTLPPQQQRALLRNVTAYTLEKIIELTSLFILQVEMSHGKPHLEVSDYCIALFHGLGAHLDDAMLQSASTSQLIKLFAAFGSGVGGNRHPVLLSRIAQKLCAPLPDQSNFHVNSVEEYLPLLRSLVRMKREGLECDDASVFCNHIERCLLDNDGAGWKALGPEKACTVTEYFVELRAHSGAPGMRADSIQAFEALFEKARAEECSAEECSTEERYYEFPGDTSERLRSLVDSLDFDPGFRQAYINPQFRHPALRSSVPAAVPPLPEPLLTAVEPTAPPTLGERISSLWHSFTSLFASR